MHDRGTSRASYAGVFRLITQPYDRVPSISLELVP